LLPFVIACEEQAMAKRSMEQLGLVDGLVHPRVGQNQQLDRIVEVVDWAAIEQVLAQLRCGERGPPPYPALLMFKALLLQQWYQLSDPGLEQALADRLSFRRFLGLRLEDATPDHSTLWRFREALRQGGLDAAVFAELNRQLSQRGLIVKRGTLVDATLVQAQGRRPDPDRAPVDPDATVTMRQGKSHYGYKAHIGVDQDSQLIRRLALTPANVNDTVMGDAMICGDEQAVYADKAYDSHARRAQLRARGITDGIMHRPNKHHPVLSPQHQAANRTIAPIRSRVETLFGIWKRHYGYTRVRYYNLSRNLAQLYLMAIASNLRRVLVLS
jgi:transposase, IS5 family